MGLDPAGRRFLDRYDPPRQASILIAVSVSDGLTGVCEGLAAAASLEQHLNDDDIILGPAGTFFLQPQITDLVSLAYHTLALTLTHAVPVATCPQCQRRFTPNHGNQHYCSPACRNRQNTQLHRQRTRHTQP